MSGPLHIRDTLEVNQRRNFSVTCFFLNTCNWFIASRRLQFHYSNLGRRWPGAHKSHVNKISAMRCTKQHHKFHMYPYEIRLDKAFHNKVRELRFTTESCRPAVREQNLFKLRKGPSFRLNTSFLKTPHKSRELEYARNWSWFLCFYL